jgi:hypothetical protein
MPLFYFDIDDGLGSVLRDDEGVSYAEMSDACQEAVKTLCEMGRDFSEHGSQEMSIIVRDAEGTRRLRVTLSLTVHTEH